MYLNKNVSGLGHTPPMTKIWGSTTLAGYCGSPLPRYSPNFFCDLDCYFISGFHRIKYGLRRDFTTSEHAGSIVFGQTSVGQTG